MRTSKGVQYGTLSALCEYLNCGASDLSEYINDQKKLFL
ncbi:helix-turn-helix domain-containing protein [Domibacillus antri]